MRGSTVHAVNLEPALALLSLLLQVYNVRIEVDTIPIEYYNL